MCWLGYLQRKRKALGSFWQDNNLFRYIQDNNLFRYHSYIESLLQNLILDNSEHHCKCQNYSIRPLGPMKESPVFIQYCEIINSKSIDNGNTLMLWWKNRWKNWYWYLIGRNPQCVSPIRTWRIFIRQALFSVFFVKYCARTNKSGVPSGGDDTTYQIDTKTTSNRHKHLSSLIEIIHINYTYY